MTRSSLPRPPFARQNVSLLGCLALVPLVVAVVAVMVAFQAFLLMVILGALSHMTSWDCAVSFQASVLIVIGLGIVGGFFSKTS